MNFFKKNLLSFLNIVAIVIGLLSFPIGSVFSAEVIEVPVNPDDANVKILAILNKINPGSFYEDPKTGGFIKKYQDKTFSPFDYKIYIGRMSQRSVESIIRVESSDRGQEKVWKRIIESEILQNPPAEDMRKLEKKSHILSQGLNLIQPSMSVIYNSSSSPLYNFRDSFWAATAYLLTDLVLVGGAYAYVSDKAPRKSLWDNLLNRQGPPELIKGPDAGTLIGALAVTRLYRVFGSVQDTTAHNRLVELQYSFSF